MERFVRAELGLPDEDGDALYLDDAALYHALPTAIFLWTAWRKHGVMPRGGGLLDQPRTWRADMEHLNLHYAAKMDVLLPELERQYSGGREMHDGEDAGDLFGLKQDGQAVRTWEDLSNGGK